MLSLEITHSGRMDRKITSLGYNCISIMPVTYERVSTEIPVATARADVRIQESCMAKMAVIEAVIWRQRVCFRSRNSVTRPSVCDDE